MPAALMSPVCIATHQGSPHPGQRATVKITAYNCAIYGSLAGRVTTVPDTIRDEVDPNIYFYRVFVRADSEAWARTHRRKLSIVPGMMATMDIRRLPSSSWSTSSLTLPSGRAVKNRPIVMTSPDLSTTSRLCRRRAPQHATTDRFGGENAMYREKPATWRFAWRWVSPAMCRLN